MADNKQKEDKRDRNKIDINDSGEVEYVHKQFPNLSHSDVVEAIRRKGPNREDVMKYLKSKK